MGCLRAGGSVYVYGALSGYTATVRLQTLMPAATQHFPAVTEVLPNVAIIVIILRAGSP